VLEKRMIISRRGSKLLRAYFLNSDLLGERFKHRPTVANMSAKIPKIWYPTIKIYVDRQCEMSTASGREQANL
jgi:hypothetical protein